MRHVGSRVFFLLAATVLAGVQSSAAVDLPVHTLTPSQAATGSTQIPLANVSFRTSAMASVNVPTDDDAKTTAPKVKRATAATSAVYQSLPHSDASLLPPMPTGTAVFDFKMTHDSAQAWATMNGSGVPYLFVQGFGEFEASATAAWTARVTTPAGVDSEVIVRFTVPPVSVTGNYEQDAPALYQSRGRVELLVSGYPVWSTEALGFNQILRPDPQHPEYVIQDAYVDTFGTPLTFASPSAGSNLTTVYLTLGVFPPGRAVDLTMMLRVSTHTIDDPKDTKKRDNLCRYNPVNNEAFCSRGTASVAGNPDALPGFYVRPAP